jgi:hypothetical protein
MQQPDWLPFLLSIGAPGPFTVQLTQFSSMLIGYYYILFLSREAKMLAGLPWVQCYGRQQCHTLFDRTASDRGVLFH